MAPRHAALAVLVVAIVCSPRAAAVERQVPDSLVFARNGDLYRITTDGVETVKLTMTKAAESDPAVSPTRSLVAYRRGDDELWIMRTDGTEQRRLLAARPRSVLGASTGSPSWSPGGRTIYFHRWSQPWNPHCASIFRIGVGGRGLRRVTGEAAAESSESDPAVSPDGRRIAISSSSECDPGWYGRLAVVDTRGRPTPDLRKLRRTPGAAIAPSWAPNGTRIAFEAWDFLELEWSVVYVVNRDGSGLRRVTERRLEAACPQWSPSGQRIAVAGVSGLYVVYPDGSGLTHVLGTRADDGCPAWLPRT
jgi:Tol biopolymer transport system component